jgi:hypothetical protein
MSFTPPNTLQCTTNDRSVYAWMAAFQIITYFLTFYMLCTLMGNVIHSFCGKVEACVHSLLPVTQESPGREDRSRPSPEHFSTSGENCNIKSAAKCETVIHSCILPVLHCRYFSNPYVVISCEKMLYFLYISPFLAFILARSAWEAVSRGIFTGKGEHFDGLVGMQGESVAAMCVIRAWQRDKGYKNRLTCP